MDNVYSRLALNLIGQCEIGNVDCVVLVKDQRERAKLVDTIAYFQKPMKFEAFARAGVVTIFGVKINIVVTKNNKDINKMKFGNVRVYNLET